ncbi:hypothetical protein L2E82_05831 [Cichorium intybus]|uniref:Uncharacterized protein n=1 Tax=Cichorium intybus TaxID=13427 RepID=A0ACB9H7V8_CICIN|nr:hypothetical protein L2E82_05831 [Cichorium intybus]
MDPWEGSRSKMHKPFAWIREAFSSSEQDVIAMSGVDSTVYFVFLGTGSRSKMHKPFAWIREAFSSSEQDVIAMSGVDSTVYFVFLGTGSSYLYIFLILNLS